MIEVIVPYTKIVQDKEGIDILKKIELFGRVCYKSEDKITEESSIRFIKNLIQRKHFAVIEHEKVSVIFVCDRGVSHEIVRHRIGSYCQESTRYVNYQKRGIQFISPCFWKEGSEQYADWFFSVRQSADAYETLIKNGAKPEEARSVLPNSLKTEIVVTYNLREWRHFFSLRCSPSAHPQMRELTIPLLKKMKEYIPIIFDDIVEAICQQ